MQNQKSNLKNQNDKEKFKKEFIARLIRFTISVLKFSDELRTKKSLWSVSDQLIRSAGSIGANVVEAKSSSSKKDYINFFQIALKSANETKYWLLVIQGYSADLKDTARNLCSEAEELSKILSASVLTLKGKK